MSEATGSKTGGRFLSKVLKFIRSPTTDWSELDQDANAEAHRDQPVDESAIELKEMIERKRRNDFVRNRELEMLRKVRRRQMAGDRNVLAPPSVRSVDSVDVRSGPPPEPDPDQRARIDALEKKMNGAWLDRANRGQSEDAEQAFEKTVPSDMGSMLSIEGDALPQAESSPGATFEKTQPAAWISVQGVDDLAAPAAAEVANAEPAIDMLDEVPPPATPEIEEVAILFANGDVAGAETGLLALVGDGGSLQGDLQTWLMLFDLYRAAGDPKKFDSTAASFVRRFGRSAPQWEVGAEPGDAHAPVPGGPAVAAAGQAGAAVAHWTAPSTIGTQSIATLNASLDRQAPPWRIDWRRVKTMEPAAQPMLLDALQRWAEMPVRLKFLGVDVLQRMLAEQTPIGQDEADEQWWALRLALLRVMNEADEFDTVALNYCITYEKSPPAWEAPRCEFNPMSETGATLPPTNSTTAPSTTGPSTWLRTDVATLDAATKTDTDVARLMLVGEILDDAEPILQSLKVSADTHAIEFDCFHLRRIDFAAAGSLLNWAVQQHSQGRRVVFQNVNRLIDVFLGVIGISDYARVRRRVD